MRTRARQKFVADATALGARVPQAELYVYFVALTGGPYQQVKLILAFIKKGEKNLCAVIVMKKKSIISRLRLPTHPANRISEIRMSLCLRTQSQDTKEARAMMYFSRQELTNTDRKLS